MCIADIIKNKTTLIDLMLSNHIGFRKGVVTVNLVDFLRVLYKEFNEYDGKQYNEYDAFTSSGKVLPDSLGRLQWLLKNIDDCKELPVTQFFNRYCGILKTLTVYPTDVIVSLGEWKPLPVTRVLYRLFGKYPCCINLEYHGKHQLPLRYKDVLCFHTPNKTTQLASDKFTYEMEMIETSYEMIVSKMVGWLMLQERRVYDAKGKWEAKLEKH